MDVFLKRDQKCQLLNLQSQKIIHSWLKFSHQESQICSFINLSACTNMHKKAGFM